MGKKRKERKKDGVEPTKSGHRKHARCHIASYADVDRSLSNGEPNQLVGSLSPQEDGSKPAKYDRINIAEPERTRKSNEYHVFERNGSLTPLLVQERIRSRPVRNRTKK